jgi:hypothetical protein
MKERRRLLLLAIASAILTALLVGCGAGSHASSGAPAKAPKCAAKALRLALQPQGTATQSVAFLALANNSQAACLASGKAVFTVEQNGRPAKVRNNPLTLPVRIRLLAEQNKTVPGDVWWNNWCGSRRKINLAVRFDGSVARSPFSVLPVCLDRKDSSRLVRGPAS